MISARLLPPIAAALALLAAGGLAQEARQGDARLVTLERAYDITLATDDSIRVAYLEVRKAALLPWSALTRLGPQLSATTGYNRTRASTRRTAAASADGMTGDGSQTERTRANRTTAGLSFTQPLIDLTVFPAYRLGKLSAEAARLQHRFTIRGTLFGVAQAYYAVLEQQRLVRVNREALRLSKEQLGLSQTRSDVGEVTRSDVLRAEVTFQTARRTLIESENTLESRHTALGNILSFAPGTDFRVAEPPGYPTKLPGFGQLLARARANREDLRVQEFAVQQDIERRKEIIASYGPQLDANFDTSLNRNSGTSDSRGHTWTAGVGVNWPIFTGGQREIDLATSRLQIEQTQRDRDALDSAIIQEVKDAWLTVRSLEETLKALSAQVAAAEQGYQDLQYQYRAGAATSVDVLTSLNDLNTARKDFAVQTYAYQVALRNIEQVTGVFQERRVHQAKVR